MIPTFLFCHEPRPKVRTSSVIDGLYDCTLITQETNPQHTVRLFKNAVSWCKLHNYDYFLVCTDQTSLSSHFDYKQFCTVIEHGKNFFADILICSAVGIDSPIPTSKSNLYWIDKAYGINCMIVFRAAYDYILSLSNIWNSQVEVTGYITQKLHRKLIVSPYLTNGNHDDWFVKSKWGSLGLSIEELCNWQKTFCNIGDFSNIIIEDLCLPVYIINLPERKDRLEHILNEFEGRTEFEINVISACKNECGALGLWLSLRKIIKMAIKKNEDIIIICEDDHHFTPNYSKEFLFRQIMYGYSLGADYLNGGCADFKNAYVMTEHLFGMATIRCTQFIIIYKDFFSTILEADFDKNVLADIKLSELTGRKMVIYPFVSVQKDFGYSDVTWAFNQNNGFITTLFNHAQNRLENIRRLTSESASL